jgi:hypothetical protein
MVLALQNARTSFTIIMMIDVSKELRGLFVVVNLAQARDRCTRIGPEVSAINAQPLA